MLHSLEPSLHKLDAVTMALRAPDLGGPAAIRRLEIEIAVAGKGHEVQAIQAARADLPRASGVTRRKYPEVRDGFILDRHQRAAIRGEARAAVTVQIVRDASRLAPGIGDVPELIERILRVGGGNEPVPVRHPTQRPNVGA